MSAVASPPKRGGRKPGATNAVSAAAITREIQVGLLASLRLAGGATKFLNALRKSHPELYVGLLVKYGAGLLTGKDAGQAGVTFIVEEIKVIGAPVPGVIASPIAAHVSSPPLRLAAAGGEVIDAEPR